MNKVDKETDHDRERKYKLPVLEIKKEIIIPDSADSFTPTNSTT